MAHSSQNFIDTVLTIARSAVKIEAGCQIGSQPVPGRVFLLFALVVELLAIKISNRDDIKNVLRNTILPYNLKHVLNADVITLLLKIEAHLNVA